MVLLAKVHHYLCGVFRRLHHDARCGWWVSKARPRNQAYQPYNTDPQLLVARLPDRLPACCGVQPSSYQVLSEWEEPVRQLPDSQRPLHYNGEGLWCCAPIQRHLTPLLVEVKRWRWTLKFIHTISFCKSVYFLPCVDRLTRRCQLLSAPSPAGQHWSPAPALLSSTKWPTWLMPGAGNYLFVFYVASVCTVYSL